MLFASTVAQHMNIFTSITVNFVPSICAKFANLFHISIHATLLSLATGALIAILRFTSTKNALNSQFTNVTTTNAAYMSKTRKDLTSANKCSIKSNPSNLNYAINTENIFFLTNN